ncbi:UDP-N-acetylmuramoyl-tripeptide--D-alanyl-D-alanine ligase [Sporosarcina ureilytica]|uniref:UDP-N-acetylmuramoyl-tripeptide--D-alanyl-D- alanine ligase n=1 Tax=Sporosarcina ureilytica TaxID=298596 RepID=UPI00094C9625|nr:UDP-N-acetylmuramoyl-tripeptide--D-alanyl-D-alanine ligase [Sporosarcina ureilytica]
MKERLKTVADWLQVDGQHVGEVIIHGVSIDSRTVKEGDLFIPFRGEQVNGHRYVQNAIEQGAAASLWLKDEPNPPENIPLLFVEDAELALQEMARAYRSELNCKVIGITGSNGKTSTKDLVASVLSPYANVKKTEGNFNNELGLPLTILSLEKDTDFAVLEMGMSGFGEISFLSTLAKPDYVVITNIGEAHMQDLGSREGIAKAKFEIIDGLSEVGKLLFDGDEPLLQPLVKQATEMTAYSFGYGESNDLALQSVQSTDAGSEFTVKGLLNGTFTIPVFGAHQVKNTLAAILIAKEVGVSVERIQQALKSASLTAMRMQPVIGKNDALFINDAYNAAPTSMQAALSFLKETGLRKEKWVVLGDMLELGENEKAYHEALSEDLLQMDLAGILLYGPRMKWLYDVLEKKINNQKLLWSESEYGPIEQELKKNTGSGAVVLLKGSRGMALEHVLNAFLEKDFH